MNNRNSTWLFLPRTCTRTCYRAPPPNSPTKHWPQPPRYILSKVNAISLSLQSEEYLITLSAPIQQFLKSFVNSSPLSITLRLAESQCFLHGVSNTCSVNTIKHWLILNVCAGCLLNLLPVVPNEAKRYCCASFSSRSTLRCGTWLWKLALDNCLSGVLLDVDQTSPRRDWFQAAADFSTVPRYDLHILEIGTFPLVQIATLNTDQLPPT